MPLSYEDPFENNYSLSSDWRIVKMLIIIYYVIIASVGLIFNALVLFSVIKYKILRKKQYAILVSLAVCDLLKVVVIVNMILYTCLENMGGLCEKNSALGTTLLFSSTFHLALESINRCFMIIEPYKYLSSLKKAYMGLMILLIWLLPAIIIIGMPVMLFGDEWITYMHFEIDMFSCSHSTADHTKDDIYVIVVHVIFMVIPLVIMFVAYGVMLKTSCKTAKNIRAVSLYIPKSPTVKDTTYSVSIINMVVLSYDVMSPADYLRFPKVKHRPNSLASRASTEFKKIVKVRRLEIKAAKTVLLIIMAFIICNTPIFALTWYDQNKKDTGKGVIRKFFLSVAMWQVVIDPVVYFLRLKDFKQVRQKVKNFGHRALRKVLRR